ncbi:MAG: bacillithiol biosynthesis cysteine-adding enzyme BshC [Chitinophagaceae bacterium]
MNTNCIAIPFQQTGYFTKIVIDYLNDAEQLKRFYQHSVSINGIKEAINARKNFNQQREILVSELKNQYQNLSVYSQLQKNFELLLKQNTFTVTTAHQPNIFTGPLYFIYKILHVIKLANYLSKQLPDYNFVPVFYMGSEDADLDELGNITINQQKYQWNTKQTGAVGRMKVDKAFSELVNAMQGQLGVEIFGDEIISLFKKCYREGVTIQQATLELVNELFGEFGLIILIPDNANLKRIFNSVVEKELTELFSHKAVEQTLNELKKHYKVQAAGREINLFYLIDDKRERVEIQNSKFKIQNLNLEFSLEEILTAVESHPERFSTNVILRGVFQETILPNIAFIGGGGELAYWLELKKVFETVNVPYPVLILRNSFLLIENKWQQKIKKLNLKAKDFFQSEKTLINYVVENKTEHQIVLNGEVKKTNELYDEIMQIASVVDVSLRDHVAALKVNAIKRLQQLEKKMQKAEKRNFDTEIKQIQKIKSALFPNNSLQERVENIAGFYAKYGKEFINVLLENSLALEQQFVILNLNEK